jgi:peptidoglycan-associated lipoprotein
MNRLVWAFALMAALAGCGSAVKLDGVPVEDKKGTSVSAIKTDTAKADGTAADQRGVASVALVKNDPSLLQAVNRTIYFDYDSFAIKPEFQSLVERQAAFIKSDRSRKVVLEGHTDERGGREYNIALGQKRAESIRRAFGLLGVNDEQMEAVSFGKEKPAVQGSSDDVMAKNRRAEISYR